MSNLETLFSLKSLRKDTLLTSTLPKILLALRRLLLIGTEENTYLSETKRVTAPSGKANGRTLHLTEMPTHSSESFLLSFCNFLTFHSLVSMSLNLQKAMEAWEKPK
ncbi:hypothetical protein A2U01_0043223, partial [Trifolium medium]|nr:hypothetical protein [Trifolium medium]